LYRFLALQLTLGLALPNPAFALRPMGAEDAAVRGGLEEALGGRPSTAGAEEKVLGRRDAINELQGLVDSKQVTQISAPGTPGMVRGGAQLTSVEIERLVTAAANKNGQVRIRPFGASGSKVDLTPPAAGAEEGEKTSQFGPDDVMTYDEIDQRIDAIPQADRPGIRFILMPLGELFVFYILQDDLKQRTKVNNVAWFTALDGDVYIMYLHLDSEQRYAPAYIHVTRTDLTELSADQLPPIVAREFGISAGAEEGKGPVEPDVVVQNAVPAGQKLGASVYLNRPEVIGTIRLLAETGKTGDLLSDFPELGEVVQATGLTGIAEIVKTAGDREAVVGVPVQYAAQGIPVFVEMRFREQIEINFYRLAKEGILRFVPRPEEAFLVIGESVKPRADQMFLGVNDRTVSRVTEHLLQELQVGGRLKAGSVVLLYEPLKDSVLIFA